MTTKQQAAAIATGPFAQKDPTAFFGSKRAAERFLVDFTEARDQAVQDEKHNRRSADCTFPEQFWDGRLFLDSDDQADIGLCRATLDDFVTDVVVYDADLDAEIRLVKVSRRRLIVVDWQWKEDEYGLDAWWLE